MNDWVAYEAHGDTFIPMEQWGKDHWNTLLYLETCAVDHEGRVDNRRMRCNLRLHREMAGAVFDRYMDGAAYPTRLKGSERANHDDWSCLEDMAAAGVLKAFWRVFNGQAFGSSEARIELTPLGHELVAQLRRHKASGGACANFEPKQERKA